MRCLEVPGNQRANSLSTVVQRAPPVSRIVKKLNGAAGYCRSLAQRAGRALALGLSVPDPRPPMAPSQALVSVSTL